MVSTEDLIKKISDEKKRKFLELYPEFHQMTATANAIGISRWKAHRWVKGDEEFSDAFTALKKDIEAEMIERHLKNVRDIAFDEKVPPQSRLLASFFELKALDDRYKDRAGGNIFVGDIVFKSSLPPPGAKIEITEGEVKELPENVDSRE